LPPGTAHFFGSDPAYLTSACELIAWALGQDEADGSLVKPACGLANVLIQNGSGSLLQSAGGGGVLIMDHVIPNLIDLSLGRIAREKTNGATTTTTTTDQQQQQQQQPGSASTTTTTTTTGRGDNENVNVGPDGAGRDDGTTTTTIEMEAWFEDALVGVTLNALIYRAPLTIHHLAARNMFVPFFTRLFQMALARKGKRQVSVGVGVGGPNPNPNPNPNPIPFP
jgi:hypothetical protein